MGTVNLSAGSVKTPANQTKMYVLERTIDFAETPYSASDVLQVFAIPAETLVLGVYYKCLTAEGATGTVDIGDDGSATRFGSNVNLNSTSTNSWSALTEGAPNVLGNLYTAANTIDLTLDHTLDAAKVKLRCICLDLS